MNLYIGIVLIVLVAFCCGWAAHALYAREWWGDAEEENNTPQDVSDYIDEYRENNQL